MGNLRSCVSRYSPLGRSRCRQLALLALVQSHAETREGQFVIATHSPILMALPGASIWSFGETLIREVPWDELEHVSFTRRFLNAPEAFLTHL